MGVQRGILPVGVFIGSALLTFVVACGQDRPGAATYDPRENATGGPGDRCATPNEGCDCDEPAREVDCGEVKYRAGDYVGCSLGKRKCAAGKWGLCNSTEIVTKNLFAGGVHGLALGTASACTVNLCDPYCQNFVDNTLGLDAGSGGTGFGIVDGGIVVTQFADGGGGSSSSGSGQGSYVAPPGGATACSPTNRNIVGPSCTVATGLTDCQQDYRCDPITLKCIWNGANGGNGYFDTTAAGRDLVVGSPCGPNGSTASNAAVCNRGTVKVDDGSPINFYQSNGMNPTDSCTMTGLSFIKTVNLSGDLLPGACVSFELVNSSGAKFVVINPGAAASAVDGAGRAKIVEGANRCKNNNAYWKTDSSPGCFDCSAACNTSISGKVYDPSGKTGVVGVGPNGGNDLPLSGIQVFQPGGALVTLADGKACDTCAAIASPIQGQAWAVTNSFGAFTINGVAVPSGGGLVPVVVQAGRYRRTHFVEVGQCGSGTVADGLIRLPRARADVVTQSFKGNNTTAAGPALPASLAPADMPKIAIATGSQESIGCFLRQVGFSDTEFVAYSSAETKRFQLFRDNGSQIASIPYIFPVNPEANYNNNTADPLTNNLNKFTAVLMDCHFNSGTRSYGLYNSAAAYNIARQQAVATYANTGGRLFMDHFPADPYIRDSPDLSWSTTPPTATQGVATWVNSDIGSATIKAKVVTGSASPPGAAAAQTRFNDWLTNGAAANAPYGAGFLQLDQPRKHVTSVGPNSIAWLVGNRSLSSGAQNGWDGVTPAYDSVLSYSFETPIVGTCGTPLGKGVVFHNSMHVAGTRTTEGVAVTGTFPNNCRTKTGGSNPGYPLTVEEKALEYQYFQLTGCSVTTVPSPPPSPVPSAPPALDVVTFTRDYNAVCQVGFKVEWGFFYYNTNVPAGTSLAFRAATASTQGALPAGPPPASPDLSAIVSAGTSSPPGTAGAMGRDANTVGQHLKSDPPASTPVGAAQLSLPWLRVYMTFNPTGTTSPSLLEWRQEYQCIPNE